MMKVGLAFSVERWRDGAMDFFVRDLDQMESMGLATEAWHAVHDDENDGAVTSHGIASTVINDALLITRFHYTLPLVSA